MRAIKKAEHDLGMCWAHLTTCPGLSFPLCEPRSTYNWCIWSLLESSEDCYSGA